MRLIIQFTLFLALLIAGITVGSQNATPLDVNFFGRVFSQKPLWMLLLISFSVGAATSLIFCSFEMLRLWGRVYSLKRQSRLGTSFPPSDPTPPTVIG